MSRADTAAVKTLVESASTALLGHVFITTTLAGVVQPFPYVIIHPAAGKDEAMRFTGPSITEHPDFIIHTVGGDADQAQLVAELIKAKLVVGGFGIIPTVAGRSNGHLYYRSPIPIQTDTSVVPALCFHVAEVGWRSNPA
jgi:hypothetical protein